MLVYNVGFTNSQGVEDETQLDIKKTEHPYEEQIELLNLILSLKEEMDIKQINYIDFIEENDDMIEELRKSLDKEIEKFRSKYLELTKQIIYSDYYKISFFEEYYSMLYSDFTEEKMSDEEIYWLISKEEILYFLYMEWISSDETGTGNWDNMMDFVKQVYKEEKNQ